MDGDKVMMVRTDRRKIRIDCTKHSMKSHSQEGFTLIEAMIALVVLLVGMLGVMGMQYYAVAGNTSSREMAIATNLSQEKVEELDIIPYSDLSNDTDMPYTYEKSMYAGKNYTRRWWVVSDCVALDLSADNNPCNDSIAATCSQDPDATVTVAVSAIRSRTCWQDKNGGWHSVTLDSLRWDDNVTP
jgi:prepilin-type N-terminal cleavage/methylation domain-containing protein